MVVMMMMRNFIYRVCTDTPCVTSWVHFLGDSTKKDATH